MAKSKPVTLEEAQKIREDAQKALDAALEAESKIASGSLLAALESAESAFNALDGTPSKDVKKVLRRLSKRILGTSNTSSGTRVSKADKKVPVDEFIKQFKASDEFTLSGDSKTAKGKKGLVEIAKDKNIEIPGTTSAAQFFKTPLEAVAEKVMVDGKAKKNGTSILWKKK